MDELIKILNNKLYQYHVKEDRIIVYGNGDVYLSKIKKINYKITFINNGHVLIPDLEEINCDIDFHNNGYVELKKLTTINGNLTFNNTGNADLSNVKIITVNTIFNNPGYVNLFDLEVISSYIEFNNTGHIDLQCLTKISGNVVFNCHIVGTSISTYNLKRITGNVHIIKAGAVYFNSLKEITGNITFGYVQRLQLDNLDFKKTDLKILASLLQVPCNAHKKILDEIEQRSGFNAGMLI